jgi:Flp pilus assembly protein TadD
LAEGRRLDPLSTIPTVNTAIAMWYLGRSREALPVLQEAFDVEPNDVEAKKYEALMLIDLGRMDDAKPLIRRLESEVARRLILSEWLGL